MPKRAVFERSRRELSLDVSVGIRILLVVEQSSLESQSRGCAKTLILTVMSRRNPPLYYTRMCDDTYTYISRYAGTPNKTNTKDTMSLDYSSIRYIGSRIG